MLDKMILGRFIPGHTYIHQLDPRLKLVYVFLLMVIIFFANNITSYSFLISIILLIMILAKLKLSFLINGLKPILVLLIFTMLMHLFLTKGGGTVFHYGMIDIQRNGIIQGIFISLRLILIIFLTTIMTLTTSPISLTDALESIFHPLKKIKIPVHELALMMSISLRFIPTLMDETTKVMHAQMARGSDMTSGPVFKRLKAVVPLLIPLFVSAFKRAEDLAVAMEVRGYRGDKNRTKYRKLAWHKQDTWTLLTLIPIAAIVFYLRN